MSLIMFTAHICAHFIPIHFGAMQTTISFIMIFLEEIIALFLHGFILYYAIYTFYTQLF